MKQVVMGWFVILCASAPALAAPVPEAARRAIAAANDAWLPAMQRQDAAAVSEPYADDAVFITPTGETATGRAGVEKLMRERFAAVRVVGGSLRQDGIEMQGTLIYEWGHADMQLERPDGQRATTSGRYLTVWKADAGGRWRIIRNLSLVD